MASLVSSLDIGGGRQQGLRKGEVRLPFALLFRKQPVNNIDDLDSIFGGSAV